MKQTFHYLSQDEVARLLQAAKRHSLRNYAILLLAYRHGLRASEVGQLRRDNLDLERQAIQIDRLKGSYGGRHLMKPDEVKALRAYLRARHDDSPVLFLSKEKGPIGRTALHRLMKKYGAAAQIPAQRCHFHALKHSIATHMLEGAAVYRSRDSEFQKRKPCFTTIEPRNPQTPTGPKFHNLTICGILTSD